MATELSLYKAREWLGYIDDDRLKDLPDVYSLAILLDTVRQEGREQILQIMEATWPKRWRELVYDKVGELDGKSS